MDDKEQQINLNIVDGEPFFSHESTINFTPTQFVVDFKCITPRTDPRSTKASFLLKHNVVMLDPWHTKNLLQVLQNVIKKYEDDFGPIKKPEVISKAEKQQKNYIKKMNKKEKESSPSYLG